MAAMGGTRIIGCGNRFRNDDGAGVEAVRRLRDLVGDRAEVIEAELAGLDVLDLMEGAQAVIVIDAARSGRPAGTIHRLDAAAASVPRGLFPHSSHALNAADAIELGRALGRLPPCLIVYGIEAGDVTAGCTLSPAVALALESLVPQVVHDVQELTCTRST